MSSGNKSEWYLRWLYVGRREKVCNDRLGSCSSSKYQEITMDLFGFDHDLNILPYDGEVFYFGGILDPDYAKKIKSNLFENVA